MTPQSPVPPDAGVERFAAATPRPWSITRVETNHFTFQLHLEFPDGSGVPIGGLRDVDAALIIAAVNAYRPERERELIEALRGLVRAIDQGDVVTPAWPVFDDARAILNRIKEGN